MAGWRILIASLSGLALTSFVILLLNVPVMLIQWLSMVFLLPGGASLDLLFKSDSAKSPLVIFAANGLIYSVVAYILVCALGLQSSTIRRTVYRMAIPGVILILLACIPSLNPLWPRGMSELAQQETELREALPVGTALDQAHAILLSKGIKFDEQTETSEAKILERDGASISANAGDHVVSTRLRTNASEFPCDYDIEVVLLFGRDEKMKTQYVHRLRICP